jgi:prepilin-type N-terminal cleavage/methylation domain-containing protein
MKSTRFIIRSSARAFTLVEMLIVVTIISLLAALTLGGYTYAMRASKRRVTTATFETIKLALERYNVDFGEYPQPTGSGQMVLFPPGRYAYDISGAACLYQALTGDGYDQIKGVTGTTTGAGGASGGSSSDGKVEGAAEIKNKMFVDIPQTIFTKKGSTYILIDGFGHPFQYIKAAIPTTPAAGGGGGGGAAANATPISINPTYDLWSYAEDDANASKKSVSALTSPSVAVRWIKNW